MKMQPILFANMMYWLQRGAYSRAELADRTSLNPLTVGAYLRALHRKGVIYVQAWRKDALGRSVTALYTLGMANDAARPAPKSRQQVAREYKQRKKATRMQGYIPRTVWVGGPYASR